MTRLLRGGPALMTRHGLHCTRPAWWRTHVLGVQRAGAGGVRVRGARRGAGDLGHHPVHANQAVQGAHVEGHRRRIPRHRRLLLPRRAPRVLGLWARRWRQRPRRAAAPALAGRRRQHDGRHPCRRKLSVYAMPLKKLVVHEFVISTSAEKGPACLSAVI